MTFHSPLLSKEQFLLREESLIAELSSSDSSKFYEKIISLGKELKDLPSDHHVQSNRIHGCQSIMYMHLSWTQDKGLQIEVHSPALVSKGIAAIIIKLYENLTPEQVLQYNVTLAEKLNLEKSLSISRMGGFASILTYLKRKSLEEIVRKSS